MTRFLRSVVFLFTALYWIIVAIWLWREPGFASALTILPGIISLLTSLLTLAASQVTIRSAPQSAPYYGTTGQTRYDGSINAVKARPRRKSSAVPAVVSVVAFVVVIFGIARYSYQSDFSPVSVEDVQFNSGETSHSLSPNLASDKPIGYRLWILGGQTLNVDSDTNIGIVVRDGQNNKLLPSAQTAQHWEAKIPQSGYYVVAVRGSGLTTITLNIPPL